MARRYHPIHSPILPRLWLMSDERIGDGLLAAVQDLPPGSGIIFRHYKTPPDERRALFNRVCQIARKRGIMLLLAGTPPQAQAWGADGAHGRHRGCITAPVHSQSERMAAQAHGAKLLLLSPVFSTRSHPGARGLGRVRLGMLMRGARVPVIALGGMTPHRARSLSGLGVYGWAAIDGLSA